MSAPLNDPATLIRGITERSKQMRERAEAMQAELAAVLEEVTSRDRVVTVTVGAGGILRNTKVESGGQRATPQQVATAVMSAYAEGCRRAGERAAQIVGRYTPGSPIVEVMRESVPPPAPEYEDQR